MVGPQRMRAPLRTSVSAPPACYGHEELLALEGEQTYDGLQRFLAMVYQLASERRLSRYALLARKGARGPRAARPIRSKKGAKSYSPEPSA